MNSRLQQFISAENISQSQLASSLGVARASITHILTGRNKPGYEFIEKLALTYPELNIEWLITGKGRMYKSRHEVSPVSPAPEFKEDSHIGEDDLFADEFDVNRVEPSPEKQKASNKALEEAMEPLMPRKRPASVSSSAGRSISRIVVFFDDGTFQDCF